MTALPLCEAIRKQSTVALSGESTDEVFGGYSWFRDPRRAVNADTYPWLVALRAASDGSDVIDGDLRDHLRLREFEAESYAQAITEVPILPNDFRPVMENCFPTMPLDWTESNTYRLHL